MNHGKTASDVVPMQNRLRSSSVNTVRGKTNPKGNHSTSGQFFTSHMTFIADTKTRHIHTHTTEKRLASCTFQRRLGRKRRKRAAQIRHGSLYKSLKLEERREITSQSSFPAASFTTKAPLALACLIYSTRQSLKAHLEKETGSNQNAFSPFKTSESSRSRRNGSCIAKSYGSPGDLAATRTSIPFIRMT